MRAPETDAGPVAATDVARGAVLPEVSAAGVLLPPEHATTVASNAAAAEQCRTEVIVASTLFSVRNQVILGRDYLPLSVSSLPGIGEPVASVERTLLTWSSPVTLLMTSLRLMSDASSV